MKAKEMKRGRTVIVTNAQNVDMSPERYGQLYPNPRYRETGIVRDLYDKQGNGCLADVEFADGEIEPYPSEALTETT